MVIEQERNNKVGCGIIQGPLNGQCVRRDVERHLERQLHSVLLRSAV